MASEDIDAMFESNNAHITHPERWRSLSALAGVGFIYGSVAIFGAVGFMLYDQGKQARSHVPVLYDYIPEYILISIGIFTALLGVILLRSVGVAKFQEPTPVVSVPEWHVLSKQVAEGNEDAISQYIRLTSLTGFTGTFTKLGLTGLPLATIGLTLFFSIMSVYYPTQFVDLAKLTLGAFIGSFVQRQAGQNGTVKLPSGERVAVKSSAVPYA